MRNMLLHRCRDNACIFNHYNYHDHDDHDDHDQGFLRNPHHVLMRSRHAQMADGCGGLPGLQLLLAKVGCGASVCFFFFAVYFLCFKSPRCLDEGDH